MRRREFIGLLGAATAIWPLAARAQQQAMPAIGFLRVGAARSFEGIVAAFRNGLADTGYSEPRDIVIEFRRAEGRYDRLPELAAELVRDRVAVITTGGGEASALAAKAATSTIPIVCNVGADPVRTGLVASLNRPGGNITGVNILTSELAAKRVGLLHDLVPASPVIAYIVNPNFPSTAANIEDVRAAAPALGVELVVLT